MSDQGSRGLLLIITDIYCQPRPPQQLFMNDSRERGSSACPCPIYYEVWGRHQSVRVVSREQYWHQWGQQPLRYFTHKEEHLSLSPLISMNFTIITTIITIVNPFIMQGCAQPDTKLPMVGTEFWFLFRFQDPNRSVTHHSKFLSTPAICEASRLFCMLSTASFPSIIHHPEKKIKTIGEKPNNHDRKCFWSRVDMPKRVRGDAQLRISGEALTQACYHRQCWTGTAVGEVVGLAAV